MAHCWMWKSRLGMAPRRAGLFINSQALINHGRDLWASVRWQGNDLLNHGCWFRAGVPVTHDPARGIGRMVPHRFTEQQEECRWKSTQIIPSRET
ncbi:hypothetical protein AAFF_G00241710 [Aldrovandia affinis]|uniref:Uncharacterized protein n=1 Tax=Aldrovandia affinis TaxID=143900 RepID=A0AAD7SUZ3_9TELE|nr:hypothetical protein AAFF_G00241710 [Aldrovandia affinis]